MPTRNFSQKEYEDTFLSKNDIRQKAISVALDVRKFEIELYWKRATYFWTFIAAALAGFAAIQASSVAAKTDLSVILSSLGFVFSVGWLCVNRGSKYWQENWENHLDLLEDKECGPIYKVIVKRRKPKDVNEYIEHFLNGPSPISVSKINQIISLYVSILWLFLIYYSLPDFSSSADVNWFYVLIIGISVCTCIAFFTKLGGTYPGGYWHNATIRSAIINNDDS